MNNNNDNNSQVLYLLYENLSQNRWTIHQAIAVMRLYNFNRELQQAIINVAARRVTQIERLMRWMDLSEYRLVAPNNQSVFTRKTLKGYGDSINCVSQKSDG